MLQYVCKWQKCLCAETQSLHTGFCRLHQRSHSEFLKNPRLRPVPQKLIRDPNRDLDRDTNSIYLPRILCIRHLGFSASLIGIICFLLKFIFVYFINCVYSTRKKIIFEFIIVYIVLCMHIARVNYRLTI